jgi:hypothetical protein
MAVYTTRENQTLLDVAVQLNGTTDNLVELAAQNKLSLTQPLPSGTQVIYDQSTLRSNAVARLFDLNDVLVVTATDGVLPTPGSLLPAPSFTHVPFPAYVPAPSDYTVREGQSVIDLALQLYGSLDNLVSLCAQNSLSLSQLAPVGQRLVFDLETQTESVTGAYIALNDRRIVTWTMLEVEPEAPATMEYDASEYDPSEYA